MKLPSNTLRSCQKDDVWSLGNDTLYNLCKKYPHHRRPDEIIAKIWLIGRSYAAAIERRKPKQNEPKGDDFYRKIVVPKLSGSRIDLMISSLRSLKPLSDTARDRALELHGYLTKLFSEISGSNKRSLASKYLHFHLPLHFYLYDNRAISGLRKALGRTIGQRRLSPSKGIDPIYAAFYLKMNRLRQEIFDTHKTLLSPRQIDRLLLQLALE